MPGAGGSPPRDPELYSRSDHFEEDTLEDSMRFLTEEMIKQTIRHGRDCDRVKAGPGKIRRKQTFDGVDAVLVIPENKPFLVTGWTEIHSFNEAIASDRWDLDTLKTIQAFQNYEHKRSSHCTGEIN